jgi:hypothetical protein
MGVLAGTIGISQLSSFQLSHPSSLRAFGKKERAAGFIPAGTSPAARPTPFCPNVLSTAPPTPGPLVAPRNRSSRCLWPGAGGRPSFGGNDWLQQSGAVWDWNRRYGRASGRAARAPRQAPLADAETRRCAGMVCLSFARTGQHATPESPWQAGRLPPPRRRNCLLG